jgi:hypothetical protein
MKRWLAAWVLVLGAPAWAHEIECPAGGSDGQQVAASAGQTESAGKIPSPAYEQTAYWLCCNRAAGACTDRDVGGSASAYLVSLEDVGTCTTIDITVGFRNDASGVNHTVGTLSLGTTSLVIPGPRNRRVTAVVNTMAGCGGDNADVRLDVLTERRESP